MNNKSKIIHTVEQHSAGGLMKSFVDEIASGKTCIWNKKIKDTNLEKFKNTITFKCGITFETYWDLHEWTVQNYPQFWEAVLQYFDVIYSGSYQQIAKRHSRRLNDIEWFCGAKMNYAENLLRFRDNYTAMVCVDEQGFEELITYAQLYEETKRYAAAFKKLGLQKGDRVACYMENRKEAVFFMLGAVSLGATWAGFCPWYGSNYAFEAIELMKPAVLITMDIFQYFNLGSNILQSIPTFFKGLSSLLKVIIVPTKLEFSDISGIDKSCFLEEFLDYGKDPDGTYPDMTFLHLPFHQPICIVHTSGTTGRPKGLVHSAIGLLSVLRDFGFHYDCKREDIFLHYCQPGWITWEWLLGSFANGNTILLYNGNPTFQGKYHFWDLLNRFKVTHVNVIPSFLETLKRNGDLPDSNCNLQHLKMLTIGASTVKLESFHFIKEYIKSDNLFVSIRYGSTESFGRFGGFDINTPAYSGEIQVPALGVDLKCFDDEGNSVIGRQGELVIATPYPGLPLYIWNDPHNKKLNKVYFSKYEGVWNQNDECWIDPKTSGIVIVGRSDGVINASDGRYNASDIYCVIHAIEEIEDYLCFGQCSYQTGESRSILFVQIKQEFAFSQELVEKIKQKIEADLTFEHVPTIILEAKEIPYGLSNKRMEKLVKTIIEKNEIPKFPNVRNPECLLNFLNISELQHF